MSPPPPIRTAHVTTTAHPNSTCPKKHGGMPEVSALSTGDRRTYDLKDSAANVCYPISLLRND
jgi:hypothetical protein